MSCALCDNESDLVIDFQTTGPSVPYCRDCAVETIESNMEGS